ncbi:hypothetical protein [uncultured Mediterranean phage]|nr:hypothetical protein [uncultured Mediterranean phage]
MGSIFKKVKKIVSKVTSPVTKLFKKVGKGIVKVGKDIWGGIKKIGGKAMKAYGMISQKLGPIGMIGMSMAMPYLMGAFGATGGGLWTGFGKMSFKGMQSANPFFKAMGYAGKGVYNAGNFVGGTTRGISQTIGKVFGSFAEGNVSQGFANFYKGASDVFSGKAGMGTGKFLSTGGVGLGNVNVYNSVMHDVTSEAMKPFLTKLSPDALKYHRTVVNTMGLDDRQAIQYITRNGVTLGKNNQYLLDKSLSTDWKFSAPPSQSGITAGYNYSFTGDNLNKTAKAFSSQLDETLGKGYKWKPKKKGDVFQTQSSLMSKSLTGSEILNAAKTHLFGDNQDDELAYQVGGKGYESASVSSNYLASQAQKSEGGMFLTEEQKKAQELLNLNIAAG